MAKPDSEAVVEVLPVIPTAITALDKWVNDYIANSKYSQNTGQYNQILSHMHQLKSLLMSEGVK